MSQQRPGDEPGGWAAVAAPFGPVRRQSPRVDIPRPAVPVQEDLRLVAAVEDFPTEPATAPLALAGVRTAPDQGAPSGRFSPGAFAYAHAPTGVGPRPWPPAPEVAWSGRRWSGWNWGLLFGVLVAVLVLVGRGGGFWSQYLQDDGAGTASATEAVEPAPPVGGQGEAGGTPLPSSTGQSPAAGAGTGTSEAEALAELGALREQTLAGLVLDGRWVAQLASKSVGITDPLQTAQNGTSTFYASDILAESLAVRALAEDPSDVLVLQSPDFGQALTAPDGQPYWVTLVDGGFASRADVEAWCAQTYPGREGIAMADVCVARTLTPPQS